MLTEKTKIIKQSVQHFKSISLEEMDKVALMNRVDRKFILSFTDLVKLMPSLQANYRILTINDRNVFTYKTDYFDTPGLAMFTEHHNGKLNRFKIRHREYIESKLEFLEIKFKNNKGKTLKKRVESRHINTEPAHQLIKEHTPYNPSVLDRKVTTLFNRLTLVDNSLTSRITIDFNLKFVGEEQNIQLENLVIIEIKQEKQGTNSNIYYLLKEKSIRPCSVSKYCLGLTMMNNLPKSNIFKDTVRKINRINYVA
ncbi:MAG: polyphosphate polymerase domain-containing protein [Bacteroidales bacterium]|nr:polyphosphate polymerase domain-containing protein [Bacteroidales bacterium]